MLKICYASINYHSQAYGSGIHSYELSKALSRAGNEIHLICPLFPGQASFETIADGVYLHRVPSIRRSVLDVFSFGFTSTVMAKRLFQEYQLNVLLSHGTYAGIFALLDKKTRFVHKTPGTISGTYKNRFNLTATDKIARLTLFPFIEKLDILACRRAQRIIVNSKAVAKELQEYYSITADKIRVVYNGVDLNMFKPSIDGEKIKDELGLSGKKIVLFAGRLTTQKGVQYVVKAAPKILRSYPETCFIIIGTGRLDGILHKWVSDLSLEEKFFFMGYIPHKSMPFHYAAADVCVFPSTYEPFPNVILEAMSCGKPIITTTVGGIPEAITDGTGILIPPNNHLTLAKQVINSLKTPDKSKEIGKKARKRIEDNFSWDKCAEETHEVLEEAMSI